ncbi:MAG: ABC transporter permease, partial [Armatimonadota bacterium]
MAESVTRDTDGSSEPIQRLWRHLRRDRAGLSGLILLLGIAGGAIFGPLLTPYDPLEPSLSEAFQPPGGGHVLGTDQLGRDLLARVIAGARASLFSGLGALAISLVLGVPIGLISGYAGGYWDNVFMAAIEVLMSFPGVLLAILAIAVLGPGQRNLVLAVGLASTPVFARLVRGSTLALREQEYVIAARALGATASRVAIRHVLPGCISPIVVIAVLRLGTTIVTVAGLGFLGLGGDPGLPEWGTMLSQGQEFLRRAPHIALVPGLAILLTVLGVN